MQFSQRLKELRTAKGVSQAELAEKIYVSRSAVAKWESGQGLPCAQSLSLIAEYFGVSYDSFLSESSSETIIVNKNVAITKYKRMLIAIGVICALAIAAVIFMLVYFLRPVKAADEAVDSVKTDYEIHYELINNYELHSAIWNREISPNRSLGYSDSRPFTFELEKNREYTLDVCWLYDENYYFGVKEARRADASSVTLDYDSKLFDITLNSEYEEAIYKLVVKEECELAPIIMYASIEDSYFGTVKYSHYLVISAS